MGTATVIWAEASKMCRGFAGKLKGRIIDAVFEVNQKLVSISGNVRLKQWHRGQNEH